VTNHFASSFSSGSVCVESQHGNVEVKFNMHTELLMPETVNTPWSHIMLYIKRRTKPAYNITFFFKYFSHETHIVSCDLPPFQGICGAMGSQIDHQVFLKFSDCHNSNAAHRAPTQTADIMKKKIFFILLLIAISFTSTFTTLNKL
jgi:hypothetical protein